ncbi:alpha-mannosidase, partial [Streptomyces sp. SID11233]|nr:alpha-mannosidase [Streptomyces sp. SID11233]
GWVHDQAEEEYRKVGERLEPLIDAAVRAATGPGEAGGEGSGAGLWANAAPFAIDGVPAHGVGPRRASDERVTLEETPEGLRVANGALVVEFDADGLVRSLRDLATGRETVPPGCRGGLLQVFGDTPRRFDAW